MEKVTERVTYRPVGGRARTIYLGGATVITMLGAECLVGLELNREGESAWWEGDRRHIIDLGCVVRRRRVVMDKTYGEFVDA